MTGWERKEVKGERESDSPMSLSSLVSTPCSGTSEKVKMEREDEITLEHKSVPVDEGLLKITTQLLRLESGRAEMHIVFGCYSRVIELNDKDYAKQYERLQENIRKGNYRLLIRQNGELDIEF